MDNEQVETPEERQERIDQRARELERNFSYDGYQVVRKELFAHLRDPAIVIRRDSVTFNTACINGLEDTVYINIMVNVAEKKLVVRKCNESDKGALRWCIARPDKRSSRRMGAREFAKKLYKDMGWSTDCRYKILGYRITAEGQTIYIFDLSETEIFLDTKAAKNEEGSITPGEQGEGAEQAQENQEKQATQKARRKGYLPEAWENNYGLPVQEHDNYRQINLREGFSQISNGEKKEGDPNDE